MATVREGKEYSGQEGEKKHELFEFLSRARTGGEEKNDCGGRTKKKMNVYMSGWGGKEGGPRGYEGDEGFSRSCRAKEKG